MRSAGIFALNRQTAEDSCFVRFKFEKTTQGGKNENQTINKFSKWYKTLLSDW